MPETLESFLWNYYEKCEMTTSIDPRAIAAAEKELGTAVPDRRDVQAAKLYFLKGWQARDAAGPSDKGEGISAEEAARLGYELSAERRAGPATREQGSGEVKRGTSICVHGTPTDKPCVVCNLNSGIHPDPIQPPREQPEGELLRLTVAAKLPNGQGDHIPVVLRWSGRCPEFGDTIFVSEAALQSAVAEARAKAFEEAQEHLVRVNFALAAVAVEQLAKQSRHSQGPEAKGGV